MAAHSLSNDACLMLFWLWLRLWLCLDLLSAVLVRGESDDSPYRHDVDSSSVHRASRMVQRLHRGEAGLEVECVARFIAFDMAMRIVTARRHSDSIFQSLQLSACSNRTTTASKFRPPDERVKSDVDFDEQATRASCCPCHSPTMYVDCDVGSDGNNNSGTCVDRPLKTMEQAQQTIRQFRSNNIFEQDETVTVYIREGICHLSETFVLTESNTAWKAFPNERVVVSGGAPLTNLSWSNVTDNILVTTLPPYVNVSVFDGLFTFPRYHNEQQHPHRNPFGRISSQIRLTRARYPNGNSEQDRMPTNYDKLGGIVSSIDAWRAAGNVSVRFPGIEKRNSSFYPWFGHSRDVRWVQDYHLENASSYYGTRQQFWRPKIATVASYVYNTSNGPYSPNPPSVSAWGDGGAILHVIHYDWWGNWQWEVNRRRTEKHSTGPKTTIPNQQRVILDFGRGGWQDAHGGEVSHNYFFVENVLQELDSEGEFYVDKIERKLYFWPLPEQRDGIQDWEFVATQLPVILQVGRRGRFYPTATAKDLHLDPVHNILIEGITFSHTTTTFLSERYTVPSAGDWSVLPKGAVTVRNAVNVTLESCSWLQVNGNGVALHGKVHDSTISRGDFVKVGDSGIVSVGHLPKMRPYDGFGVESVPSNITVSQCHFGQTGVYGKQTSALFIALSKGIQFVDNVLYDGPRAGININDGFCGGHRLARNVIFNQVLESGDHGPINTWSRSAYMQEGQDDKSTMTVIPAWNYIDQNFVMMGPKFGALYGPGNGPCSNGDPKFYCPKNDGSLFSCLDHDDGSEYYLDTRNVCAFAGMKNYIGQNKIWDSNLLVFPEGAKSQNRSGTSCIWTSMDMAGEQGTLPCSVRPCRTKEVYTNNTCLTYSSSPLEYDMFNETDLHLNGVKNTTIPFTARNRYYLNHPYKFLGKWNLSETQAQGIDIGSTEYSLYDLSLENIDWMARNLLDLDLSIEHHAID